MYTNWPFGAKTNTHTIHMSEFCQKRFSTETDVSIKSAKMNGSLLALQILRSNLQGGKIFSSPNSGHQEEKTRSTEPKLKCFSIKRGREKKKVKAPIGCAQSFQVSCQSSAKPSDYRGVTAKCTGNQAEVGKQMRQ